MKERKEQAYIAPYMEVISIEVEQVILAASTENIGVTLEELDW
jgi:hypothetical protein